MIISIFMKVFSDACLCFALLGTFYTVFPASYPPVYAAIACGAGAAVAGLFENAKKPGLRWLGILLPACSLPIVCEASGLLILLPVVAYTAFVIARGRLHLEYHSFRHNFRNSLILLSTLYVAFCMLGYLEQLSAPEHATIDTSVTLRYGIVYAVSGIFLQRHLRLGVENHALGTGGQVAALFGLMGASVLGLTVAGSVLRRGAALIFQAFLHIILLIPFLIYHFCMFLFNRDDVDKMQEAVEQATESTQPSVEPVVQNYVYEAMQAPREEPSYWWVILVVLLVFCVMMWLLLAYRNRALQTQSEEFVGKVSARKQANKESRRSNRGRIRQYYREYLRLQRKQGGIIKKHMTTEDILRQITYGTDRQAAEDLRQAYLPARYCRTAEVTAEQVETARDALRRIRG